MSSEPANPVSRAAERGFEPARAPRGARVLGRAALRQGEMSYEFQGDNYGEIGVSAIVVDAPPGNGPKLHKHPYVEVFVLLEGRATFTAGDDMIEAVGGQIVIVPADVPHKFVNSGTGPLRQVDIHPSGQFITEWLED